MTEKLYWQATPLTNFTARVSKVIEAENKFAVVLDRTAFYPESGGQPYDLGLLNGCALTAVSVDDDEQVLHWFAERPALQVGDEVSGVVDAARRLEMTQQHTGQHILSQAFFQLFGAETKGFRITDEVTQIDLTIEADNNSVPEVLRKAEDLANQIVFDNRVIRTHQVTPEQAAQMPLRKESFVSDCVRIVEIEDFDWSPCGGTHAQRTGEIGLIAIRGWERAKQMVRVEFVCGVRALRDYRVTNQISSDLARRFTVGREAVVDSIIRLEEDRKALQRRVRGLAEIAAQVEADALWQAAEEASGLRVVTNIFTDRDFEETKLIAHRLVAKPQTIALLAAQTGEAARLVFARSADVTLGAKADMNALMKTACERLQGRGGGKPDFAQGGGNADGVESLLVELKKSLG